MADISALASQILAGGGNDENGDDLGKLLIRLINANTDPPSYYLATGDVTINGVDSVVAGTGIAVDDTDPNNPIVSATGVGSDGGGFQFNINDPTAASAGNVNAPFVPINAGYILNNDNLQNAFNSTHGATEMAFDGTLRDVIIETAAPFSGSGGVFTIYKNGVATSFVTTLPDNTGSVENTSGGLSFVRGDFLSIKVTSSNLNDYAFSVRVIPTGSAPSGSVDSVTGGAGISVDNTDPANPIVSASVSSRTSFPFYFDNCNKNLFYPVGISSNDAGMGSATYTDFDAHVIMPFAGTLTKLYLTSENIPDPAASEIFFIAVGGVDTTITATLTDAGKTANDLIHTAHFNAGDLVSLHYDNASTGSISGIAGNIGVIWD